MNSSVNILFNNIMQNYQFNEGDQERISILKKAGKGTLMKMQTGVRGILDRRDNLLYDKCV